MMSYLIVCLVKEGTTYGAVDEVVERYVHDGKLVECDDFDEAYDFVGKLSLPRQNNLLA